MPTPIFGVLFFIGGLYLLSFGLTENTSLLLIVGVISVIIGIALFVNRNRFYRKSYKPAFDEIEKRKQRLQQLVRERHYLG